jgi:hypothetical protein
MPDNPPVTHRARLERIAASVATEGMEIIAITAGDGNGWQFPAEVLHASLPLWQGVECFIDHDWKGRCCAILPHLF